MIPSLEQAAQLHELFRLRAIYQLAQVENYLKHGAIHDDSDEKEFAPKA
jgi:hypothetical protein